jgi:HlyD family secretion protein
MKSNRRKRIHRLAGGALVLVIAALALAACLPGRPGATAVPAAGETVTAFIGDLSASATASGQVLPGREVSLSARVPGRVTQVAVRTGDHVAAGDLLVQLDTADLALNVAAAELNVRLREANLAALQEAPSDAEIASAQAAVAGTQASLDELLAGPSDAQIAVSQAGLRSAQASLQSAQAELARVQSSITDSQIEAAQAALLAAQLQQRSAVDANEKNPTQATDNARRVADQAVAQAQADLDALLAGPDQGTLAGAQGSVTAAAANVRASQADLDLQLAGATEAQISAARSQLAQAAASLADLEAGPTDEEVVAAESELAQAQLSLADAQEVLAEATLTAPFAGVVTAVHVSEGEVASGVVVELMDESSLEVVLEVDEIDVAELVAGQPATITLETWPDVQIESQLLAIAPSATTEPGSSLVTYEAHLGLGAADLPVRAGMTANASLVTARRQGVLLVPNAAIMVDRQAGKYSVNLVVDGSVQEVEVTVGLHDDNYTQITSGLQPGDELWIGAPESGSDLPGGGFFGNMRRGN